MDEKDLLKFAEKTEDEKQAVELRNSFPDFVALTQEISRRIANGEMTADELIKINSNLLSGTLKDHVKNGNWENVVHMGIAHKKLRPLIFGELFNFIPTDSQRVLALECYTIDGFADMNVIKRIRELDRVGKKGLPKSLRKKNTIVVYRAGEEEPSEASERLSWTTSYSTALFFFEKHHMAHAKYLFKAEIDPEDIIAYIKSRNEDEILQYKGVKNIMVMRKNPMYELAKARYQELLEVTVGFDS